MAKKKFKAAVIGCGNIGAGIGNYNKAIQPGTHVGAYRANVKTELSALVENDKTKLAGLSKNFPCVKIFSDAEAMLKEIKPDIVSIATPTALHYGNVILAAKYKCPAVLCEKPISYSLNEAQKMITACKKSGSLLFVNHQRRFDLLLNRWSEKINSGFLGKIYQGNAYYYNGLFNNGTHLVDLLSMFLGDPSWMSVDYNQATSDFPNDKNADGIINFNGVNVSLQSLSKNYGYFGFNLFGEKGMLAVTNLGYEVQYRKKVNNKYFKNYFELSEKIEKEGESRSFMNAVINNIVSCLEGKALPISSGEDGLKILKILLNLKSSADQKGRKIKINA